MCGLGRCAFSDRNDILFKGEEKKRREKKERKMRKAWRDGSVGRSGRWNSLLPSVAFGKEGGEEREAEGGWKKDGKDESEALQLGGVVLN